MVERGGRLRSPNQGKRADEHGALIGVGGIVTADQEGGCLRAGGMQGGGLEKRLAPVAAVGAFLDLGSDREHGGQVARRGQGGESAKGGGAKLVGLGCTGGDHE